MKMNLPNKLTIIRILLSFVIMIILLFPFHLLSVSFPKLLVNSELIVDSKYIIAGLIFIIASLTDFLDGYIARKYKLITDLGKMLDSIADKILVNGVLIVLAGNGFISPAVPLIIVIRDIIVDAIKMAAAAKGKVVAAIWSGKIKTASLMVGIVLTLFYNLPFELWNLRVADFLLFFATILSLVSLFEYYKNNKVYFKEEVEK